MNEIRTITVKIYIKGLFKLILTVPETCILWYKIGQIVEGGRRLKEMGALNIPFLTNAAQSQSLL